MPGLRFLVFCRCLSCGEGPKPFSPHPQLNQNTFAFDCVYLLDFFFFASFPSSERGITGGVGIKPLIVKCSSRLKEGEIISSCVPREAATFEQSFQNVEM